MRPALMGLQGGNMEFSDVKGEPDEVNPEIRVQGQCVITGEIWSVVVKVHQMENWIHQTSIGGPCEDLSDRVCITNFFPDLNSDGREFLISGISPTGWKEVFG
jgi:hypothetical protein